MTAEQIIKSLTENVQYVKKAGCPFVAAVIEKAILKLRQAESLHKALSGNMDRGLPVSAEVAIAVEAYRSEV